MHYLFNETTIGLAKAINWISVEWTEDVLRKPVWISLHPRGFEQSRNRTAIR